MFDDYRQMEASKLPSGVVFGAQFTSVCINTAIYLPWLVSQCLALGVVFRRGVLKHISEAAGMGHAGKADIIINASGLLACRLDGVMDPAVYPARGQVVVVRNGTTLHGCD
jgi:D-amino-acid oxidase